MYLEFFRMRELPFTLTLIRISSWIWMVTNRRRADAWQNGAIATYLAAYDTNYMPAYVDTYEAWEAQRRYRIDGVQGINTSFDRLELLQVSDEQITARFWLYYSCDNYADETLKELTFINSASEWKILENRSIEIITGKYNTSVSFR